MSSIEVELDELELDELELDELELDEVELDEVELDELELDLGSVVVPTGIVVETPGRSVVTAPFGTVVIGF